MKKTLTLSFVAAFLALTTASGQFVSNRNSRGGYGPGNGTRLQWQRPEGRNRVRGPSPGRRMAPAPAIRPGPKAHSAAPPAVAGGAS